MKPAICLLSLALLLAAGLGAAEIYFVANPTNHWENVNCTFRIAGKAPELWLADTGEMRRSLDFEERDGRTVVPMRLEP
jgi:hypothetical protein